MPVPRTAHRRAEIRQSLRLAIPPAVTEGRQIGGVANGLGAWDDWGTRLALNALDASIAERGSVPVLWVHDPSKPIGRTTRLAVEGSDLAFDARLTAGVRAADEALALIGDGAVAEVSIAFAPREWVTLETDEADEVRAAMGLPDWWPIETITRADLVEISPVPRGSNPHTSVELRALRSATDYDDYLRRLSAPPAKRKGMDDELRDALAALNERIAGLESRMPEGDDTDEDGEDAPADDTEDEGMRSMRRRLEQLELQRDAATFALGYPEGATVKLTEASRDVLFRAWRSDPAAFEAAISATATPAAVPVTAPRSPWATRGSASVEGAAPVDPAAETHRRAKEEAGADPVKTLAAYKRLRAGGQS
jgi:uncharacterized protein